MVRPIKALIRPAAIVDNLSVARGRAGGCKVWAVAKANAYGHGIERVFDALCHADGIAVLDFDEAQRLRGLGWRGPLLMLEGCFERSDLDLCHELSLRHVVHHAEQVDWLAAEPPSRRHCVVLKMNSGMNRLGFPPDEYGAAWRRLTNLPGVGPVALATHFSDADGPPGIAHQLRAFHRAACGLPGERSLANSAALLRHFESLGSAQGDWVRAGVMLYGGVPDHPAHTASDWKLKPAMELRSRVIAVQSLQEGDTVGYGSTHVAAGPERIGVVACGYADGYPRHAGKETPVLVQGQLTRLVGRVSMDMLTVDLTAESLAHVGVGADVTLWGDGLPIDDVAAAAGTIGYELMCALAQRVPVVTAG